MPKNGDARSYTIVLVTECSNFGLQLLQRFVDVAEVDGVQRWADGPLEPDSVQDLGSKFRQRWEDAVENWCVPAGDEQIRIVVDVAWRRGERQIVRSEDGSDDDGGDDCEDGREENA